MWQDLFTNIGAFCMSPPTSLLSVATSPLPAYPPSTPSTKRYTLHHCLQPGMSPFSDWAQHCDLPWLPTVQHLLEHQEELVAVLAVQFHQIVLQHQNYSGGVEKNIIQNIYTQQNNYIMMHFRVTKKTMVPEKHNALSFHLRQWCTF